MQECTIGGDCTEMMRKMGHTSKGFASVVADATSKRAHPPVNGANFMLYSLVLYVESKETSCPKCL